MAEPTKAELLIENSKLRERVEELESGAAGTTKRPTPELPSFTLSQGTVSDILRARDEISANPRLKVQIVTEPFTSRAIYVTATEVRWDGSDGEHLDVPGLPRAETTFEAGEEPGTSTVTG